MKELKQLIKDGRVDEARNRLRELAFTTDRYPEFSALSRMHAKLASPEDAPPPKKIALLGVGTTDFLAPALSLALDLYGVHADIHAADYGTYAREMLDPESETIRFEPDVAVIVNSPTSLPARPEAGQSAAEVDSLVDQVVAHWLDLCQSLHAHAGCDIVLDNFHPVSLRPIGNLAAKTPWSMNNFLRRVNLALGDRAPGFVHVSDVDSLSARCGLERWFDPRLWHSAKLAVAPECLPVYAKNAAQIIGAIYGRAAKCLVLDLDNTLWGGVIGDDGLDGIRLGQGNAEGEAFLAFQDYILELKARGVLLAVSSKNTEATALEVFEKHPEMRIRREDIVSFKANWGPKPDSIQEIARELNIGLDALVFVDDNPREREIVRQWTPEVRVVELSEDASDYPRLLDQTGWFETVNVSDEDRTKTEQYRANASRAEQQASVGDYGAYLESLEQVAHVAPYQPEHLDRISQLANKSNQFNLTTRRQSRTEVEAEMRDPDRLTATVRLVDRFGDNGLICVFSSIVSGARLEIDQWLMSCRVLNRGVEHLLLNWVVERARALGIEEIDAAYVPTAKNALVKDHYASLGFAPMEGDPGEGGSTHWRLALADYSPFDVSIEIAAQDAEERP